MDQRGNGSLPGIGAPTPLRIQVDDLAFLSGEAIAWPVSASLTATTPLLRRVEQAAGPALAAQLRSTEPLPVGSAIVTGAGALAVGLLISAVVRSDEEPVSAAGVRRALTSTLQRAADWGIEALYCAPFGLGAGNLAIEQVADVMVSTIRQHLARGRGPREITIVVENELEESAFATELLRGAA